MNIMFDTSFIFEKIDVSGFDTKLETDMTYMFESLNKVEIIDVSKFKALNLKKDMFSECSSGEKLDASKFNKTKVIYMSFMFT